MKSQKPALKENNQINEAETLARRNKEEKGSFTPFLGAHPGHPSLGTPLGCSDASIPSGKQQAWEKELEEGEKELKEGEKELKEGEKEKGKEERCRGMCCAC